MNISRKTEVLIVTPAILVTLSVFVFLYLFLHPKKIELSLATFPGDCDGDGFVDLFDYGYLSRSFGLTQGQPGFDGRCDFHVDQFNIIDLFDYQILANNFGQSGNPSPTPRLSPTDIPNPTSPPLPSVTVPPLPGNPDFIVSQNGCSDSGPGNLNQPFCTIPRAITAAQPGSLIAVRSGNYSPFTVSKSGSSGAYITIAAYGNERPRINGGSQGIGIVGKSYIRIVGFEVTGATGGYGGGGILLAEGANNNIVEGNNTHDNAVGYTSGININASSNNKIIGNTSYRNGLKGIRVAQGGNNQLIGNHTYENTGNGGGSDGITTTEGSTNNLIRDNISHNNSDDGIDGWSSHGNTYIGNIAYDNRGPGDGNGFKLGGVEQGGQHLVIGNVSVNNKRDGFDSNHSFGNTYYHNVSVGNGGVGFRDTDKFPNCIYSNCRTIYINNIGYNNNKNFAASPHTAVSHNNIWYSDTGGANVTYQGSSTFTSLSDFFTATGNRLDNPNAGNQSSLSVNPSFVNATARNFRLNANSPAINKGDPANPAQIRSIGIPDIGAFEYGL